MYYSMAYVGKHGRLVIDKRYNNGNIWGPWNFSISGNWKEGKGGGEGKGGEGEGKGGEGEGKGGEGGGVDKTNDNRIQIVFNKKNAMSKSQNVPPGMGYILLIKWKNQINIMPNGDIVKVIKYLPHVLLEEEGPVHLGSLQ